MNSERWHDKRLLMGMLIALFSVSRSITAQETPSIDTRLQSLFLEDAKQWEMWIGVDHKRKAELVIDPVFRWQNLGRERGQTGAMFIWMSEGRPVVIGGVFSNPAGVNKRDMMHEFHAIGPDRLFPEYRGSKAVWNPSAGVPLVKLPDSPHVEDTPAKRMLQLRSIGRDFAATTVDDHKQSWQLRLLPKPLYRYTKPQGDIIDGAVMAFLSDVGTDPEIILVLEARQTGDTKAWYYRTVRLSISDLYVDYKGERVWTSLRKDLNASWSNEDNTYLLFRDRAIDDFVKESGK
jgi:hypothetical protein